MHLRSRSRRLVGSALVASTLFAGAAVAPSPAGAATDANKTYVRALYGDLLDRPSATGNDAGVTFWANKLETQTKGQVARGIQRGSTEYYGNVVDIYYQLFLDRSADPNGRSFYIAKWRARASTIETIVANLAGSAEYFDLSGDTNAGFVDKVYFDVLGREATTGEKSAGIAALATQTRGKFAQLLAQGSEAHGAHVDAAYMGFLGRSAGASERSYWVGQLNGGLRSEDFDASLVSSSEYYDRNS